MKYIAYAIMVGLVSLSGCDMGIEGGPVALSMEHSRSEEQAANALRIQKNPDFILPSTNGSIEESRYNRYLIIPEDLRD